MHLAFVELEFELEVNYLEVDIDDDENVYSKQGTDEANR